VFLEDLLPRPALRAIELGDERRPVFHAHLIDTVLVAVERQDAGIGGDADTLHGFQHGFRAQGLVGMDIGRGQFSG
jgi:hypothetical protein